MLTLALLAKYSLANIVNVESIINHSLQTPPDLERMKIGLRVVIDVIKKNIIVK